MLTSNQCREADRMAIECFGIPGLVLMENAGRSCVQKLIWHSPQLRLNEQAVVILCGPGNNGGDGFVMARHLYNQGIDVKVVLFRPFEKYHGDARINLNSLNHLRINVVQFDENWDESRIKDLMSRVGRKPTTWIVDCLLGTGASGPPRAGMAKAIMASSEINSKRMAVDIPTGVDANSGTVADVSFEADVTCTFIDEKTGFGSDAAKQKLGVTYVVDIGLPPEIIDIVASAPNDKT